LPTVLFFGPARDAAGESRVVVEGASVKEVVAATLARFGEPLANLLPTCRVWLNGEQTTPDTPVNAGDELAVLPPVSGG
jgi:molybdopterin converting factor small subunit